jgi:putative transposase
MKAEEARRLKELEIENQRLKRVVADQAVDIAILMEANSYLGKHRAPRAGGAS